MRTNSKIPATTSDGRVIDQRVGAVVGREHALQFFDHTRVCLAMPVQQSFAVLGRHFDGRVEQRT